MKIAYAFRRGVLYPHRDSDLTLSAKDHRLRFLDKTRELGFDGIELGIQVFETIDSTENLKKELEDAGLKCAAIRGGGGLNHPRTAFANRKQLLDAVQYAAQIGSSIVNTTVITPPTSRDEPGWGWGHSVSQGASLTASAEDFERNATGLREIATSAADLGVEISIEVHQNSSVDNGWSALHLLKLIDHPNVGINPDLGNIYWTYDVPEESCEDAILALAPHAKYWHCKNLLRIHLPEIERSIFQRVPLPDGDIDYRFAISAMLAAGFDGYLAVEGLRLGDQWHGDAESVAYVKGLLEESNG